MGGLDSKSKDKSGPGKEIFRRGNKLRDRASFGKTMDGSLILEDRGTAKKKSSLPIKPPVAWQESNGGTVKHPIRLKKLLELPGRNFRRRSERGGRSLRSRPSQRDFSKERGTATGPPGEERFRRERTIVTHAQKRRERRNIPTYTAESIGQERERGVIGGTGTRSCNRTKLPQGEIVEREERSVRVGNRQRSRRQGGA